MPRPPLVFALPLKPMFLELTWTSLFLSVYSSALAKNLFPLATSVNDPDKKKLIDGPIWFLISTLLESLPFVFWVFFVIVCCFRLRSVFQLCCEFNTWARVLALIWLLLTSSVKLSICVVRRIYNVINLVLWFVFLKV